MPIAPGTKLGLYEVLAPLGAGGMGEVYRALDTKLGRSVAIKVLPDAFASDPERVPRFEREAKVLASLNHPNIAALHGMEESGGRHLLIMELVEGETLAERLARGAFSVEVAIETALQIAAALEAAHEQGIVHRDLKPANVKITPDEKVKVLDFGLAKAMEPASGVKSHPAANSPTFSVLATQAGLVLGTAAYMSPEQAKGIPADQRSDVFSFGVVLYEMLTGRQPFLGETAAEIMASVLIREPDLAALPPNLNPRLYDLVRRSLEKTPKKRWQAIGDVRAELEFIARNPRASTTTVVAPKRALWRRAISVAVAVLVAAVAASVLTRMLTTIPRPQVVRFEIPFAELERVVTSTRQTMAISPDGTHLLYAVAQSNARGTQLLLRPLSSTETRPIPAGASGGVITSPAFSSDGQWIAFWDSDSGAIRKIAVTGGSPLTVTPAENPLGLHWADDWIVFGQTKGIMRVSPSGGDPQVIVTPRESETLYGPQLVNDGRDVLFSVTTAIGEGDRWDNGQVVVQSLASGDRKVLVERGSDGRYLESGHLVYALGSTVLAARLDSASGEVRGGPVPVLEGVLRAPGALTAAAHFTVSRNGSLFYYPGGGINSQRTLGRLDEAGRVYPLASPPQSYVTPRVSPDARQLAVVVEDAKEANVWVIALTGDGTSRRLTFGGRNRAPVWSRDGRFITFQSDRDGDRGLFQQAADGSGSPERLTKAEAGSAHFPESWSPDGRTLLFTANTASATSVWSVDLAGDRAPRRVIDQSKVHIVAPQFSPDGKWIAYGSSELSGGYFVFVQPYPSTGAKYQVTTSLSSAPVWSRDGRQLMTSFTNRIYRSDVSITPSFTFGQSSELRMVETLPSTPSTRNYDLMPDGKELVVILPGGAESARRSGQQISVVLNWFEELATKVPVK